MTTEGTGLMMTLVKMLNEHRNRRINDYT